jgi:hypothetical protein
MTFPGLKQHPGSFRDPSGALFTEEGRLYRGIDGGYLPHYELLRSSGLYENLMRDGLLVAHEEVEAPATARGCFARVLAPVRLPFISYPYEWCFGQYRAAALALLDIQGRALSRGLTLKDASAYNMQWHQGKPLLIDTLSFERYGEGEPWVAYRQFCQHFLAPLLLMSHVDARLGQLMRVHMDGVPLSLTSRLLPWRTHFRLGTCLHVHWHARGERRATASLPLRAAPRIKKRNLEALLDNLRQMVAGLRRRPALGVWSQYYQATNYGEAARDHKMELVASFLTKAAPTSVWDLGCNDARFSRLASRRGIFTLALDSDFDAIEFAFAQQQRENERCLLPLWLDLANPSPSQGWAHEERDSLAGRGPADLVMALALIHHLAIGNNTPLERVASYLAQLTRGHAIVEFVPKEDSQVQRLLATRADIFSEYHEEGFRGAFGKHFQVAACEPVRESKRTLFLLAKRS